MDAFSELLLIALSIGAGLMATLIGTLMYLHWKETLGLRKVRHEDRDMITKISSQLDLIRYDVDDIRRDVNDRYERIKWMIDTVYKPEDKEK